MQKNSFKNMQQYSMLDGANYTYLEELYENFIDGKQIDNNWESFFTNLPAINGQPDVIKHSTIRQAFLEHARSKNTTTTNNQNINLEHEHRQTEISKLISSYRLLGHLHANIDPLGMMTTPVVPELEPTKYQYLSNTEQTITFDTGDFAGNKQETLTNIHKKLQQVYSGYVGFEFMHIPDSNERAWLQNKIEDTMLGESLNNNTRINIMEKMVAAEGLEKYLNAKYPGAKRFGLEGGDSLIVCLDELMQACAKEGAREILIGMAHRGRLNVLVNLLGKNPSELFDEFEGKQDPNLISGDVKYHQGFSSDIETPYGNVHLSLAFNPSHLEIVSPVVCGSVRARLEGRHNSTLQVLPILIHGDSAFAGQGVVMELLNMSQTRGYGNGGSIHVIINNQVGFTTSKVEDLRSTWYCSDLGKMIQIPVFHVNGDHPEEVWRVSKLAAEYRTKFNKDVIIDLVCYRLNGHNEADEPMVTQPLMYKNIRKKKMPKSIYADSLIKDAVLSEAAISEMTTKYRKLLDDREQLVAKNVVSGWESGFSADWTPYFSEDWRTPSNTSVDINVLKKIANCRDTVPENFKLHSRVKKIVDDRNKMTKEEIMVDWGYAETLAYATLVTEGYPVRLSGQDCGRGTFFHRHAVYHDQDTAEAYIPLCNINPGQAPFWVIDSVLSESAVLAFEYGFSTSEPRTLVIWEAQFGDFANNAQVVIDQFISSGEQKWGRLSGLTMLLPHGYEGQGPEHSSARLERYLQACAQHNIQVCVPSTPSQVFHMLRRQVLRPLRKPLIVMSPKSLLRHPLATSSLTELANGQFYPILKDNKINTDENTQVNRVVLCSGKVYYDLHQEREGHADLIPIIRIEQLHPFPELELQAELQKYPNAKEIVWCQEEPKNQGAWYCSQHHLLACIKEGQSLSFAGREAAAAPAVGYAKLHQEQQLQLVKEALGIKVN